MTGPAFLKLSGAWEYNGKALRFTVVWTRAKQASYTHGDVR